MIHKQTVCTTIQLCYTCWTQYLKRKRTGYFNQAIEEDKKAIVIHPKFTTAYYNIGFTYLLMNNINLAEPALRKAISIAPNYADALNNLGYCFIQKDKLDSAIILCTAASKIDTTYFRPYGNLGAIYLRKNDFQKGYYYFQKAHALNPNDESVNTALQGLNEIMQNK